MSPVIYAKTAKGKSEVAQRCLGLNSRQRTVLIMLDGRKPCASLAGLIPARQLDTIVGELLAMELIGPCTSPSAAVPAPQPPVMSPELARLKTEMVKTAEACLGLMAAEVVRRIERAGDRHELLGVVGHWHMALQASRHGRETALEHVERVRASLAAM
jgi:hypothetical protein